MKNLKFWLFQDISVGGYQVVRKVGEEETVFKFHRQSKIPSGTIVSIFSSDSDETHDPPTTLVMKNQKWGVGDEINTTLLNIDGEVSILC